MIEPPIVIGCHARGPAREASVVDFLVHFYGLVGGPFRSLTDLSDEEALALMRKLYIPGSVFWERFENPERYLGARRKTEAWMREAFVAKGGTPREVRPIYMILGRSPWVERSADRATIESTREIVVPLSGLGAGDVSFTYPDSMVSMMVAASRDPDSFQPGYHGELFTLERIQAIVERKGMPDQGWETRVPSRFAHYIEAQVWNREALWRWYRRSRPS